MSEWSPDIARLQASVDDEWLAVERHYFGRLMAYVARRVPDREAREDVLQETFLGALRGIHDFDPQYTFEQYLFGICKNRTIDWLRRTRATTLSAVDEDAPPPIESRARESDTPSRIVQRRDLAASGARLLAEVLRTWVQETWEEQEFTRLMVIEALFSGGWRNRDTWQRFRLRDETSVAGIKFRALKRLRELAAERDAQGVLVHMLSEALDSGESDVHFDVGALWKKARVSCPSRHWLARLVAGTLPEGPAGFVRFHLDEMRCEWCQANRDDLERSERESELAPLLESLQASTLRYLRSRSLPPGAPPAREA